jgi:hypothetical protein
MPQDFARAGAEPDLDELMADPIMDLILKRDRIDPSETWTIMAMTAAALRRRLAVQRWRGIDANRPATPLSASGAPRAWA